MSDRKPDDSPVTWGELRKVSEALIQFSVEGLSMVVERDKEERDVIRGKMNALLTDLADLGVIDHE